MNSDSNADGRATSEAFQAPVPTKVARQIVFALVFPTMLLEEIRAEHFRPVQVILRYVPMVGEEHVLKGEEEVVELTEPRRGAVNRASDPDHCVLPPLRAVRRVFCVFRFSSSRRSHRAENASRSVRISL